MPGRTTGWLLITFKNASRIERVRNDLYSAIGAPSAYTLEDSPHISLLRFTIGRDALPGFRKAITLLSARLDGTRVPVDGFHVYPSEDNPMVVSLDPAIDTEAIRARAVPLLDQYGGSVMLGPNTPHITLFKGGVAGEEKTWGSLRAESLARLHTQLEDRHPTFSLTVSEISVTV